MKLSKIVVSLIVFLGSCSLATQKLALLANYHKGLGSPLFTIGNFSYYLPWKWFAWALDYHKTLMPGLIKTQYYIYFGIFFVIVIFLFRKKKKQLTSHGSARWAEKDDLKRMDLISASGVILGLYDDAFTKSLSKILRSLEIYKKEKEARAEMAYDRKISAVRDKTMAIKEELLEELENLDSSSARAKAIQDHIHNSIDKWLSNPHKWNAKVHNRFTVYPVVWLYKTFFDFYKKLNHFYLRDNSNRHLAVVAPTRSGKGVGLIIPTLLGSWKESVLVNDIKSENWGVTAGYRKFMGQTVIKFEPTSEDGSTARWNPLDEIPIGTSGEVAAAQNIAAILADYAGTGKPDHWTANAAQVITAVILHLKYAHFADPASYPDNPSLFTVASFLKANLMPAYEIEYAKDENGNFIKDPTTKALVPLKDENGNTIYVLDADGKPKQKIDKNGKPMYDAKGFVKTIKNLLAYEHVPKDGIVITEWSIKEGKYVERKFTPEDLKATYPFSRSLNNFQYTHPSVFDAFNDIKDKGPNELASIVSTANTALKEYLDPILAANTAVSDFCIDDIMNYKTPVSLYLVTPPSDIARLSPIFRCFVEIMIAHHTHSIGTYVNAVAKSEYKHKCLLLMDEFTSLGNLQKLASAMAYIAGYGLKAFIISQGLPQINAVYGRDNQVIMNCSTQIYYAPNDNETAKYVETQLGNKTITVENTSVNRDGLISKKSYSYSETGRALMTADEIMAMGDQEIIAISQQPKLLTDKVKYYECEYFTKRLIDAPAVSDVIRNNDYPLRDKKLQESKNTKAKRGFSYQYHKMDDNTKSDKST